MSCCTRVHDPHDAGVSAGAVVVDVCGGDCKDAAIDSDCCSVRACTSFAVES